MKKAFEILDSFGSPQIGLAGDIAIKKVVSIQDNDIISKAVQILQQHGYKQLPVRDKENHWVGSISERNISNRLLKVTNPKLLMSREVSEVMDEAFPMIAEDTPISIAIPLLQHFQAGTHDEERSRYRNCNERGSCQDDLLRQGSIACFVRRHSQNNLTS